MTLKLNKSTIFQSMMVAIIVISLFQQSVYDGTAKENDIITAEPSKSLGLPSLPPKVITDGSYDFNYTLFGNWSDTGSVHKVIVEEDTAYVADGSNGFRILDISNKSEPVEVGSGYKLGTAVCYDLLKKDDKIFLAYGTNGLVILDVSNPTSPSPVITDDYLNDFLTSGNESVAIDIDNNYAYLACKKDGLKIVSIANLEEPSTLGDGWSNGKIARDLEKKSDVSFDPISGSPITENYVFMTCANDGLRIIDVSNVLSPNLVGSYTGIDPYGLTVKFNASINERTAFVAESTGIYLIPLITPKNIPTMETDGYNNIYTASKLYHNIWLEGRKLFAVSPTDGLKIYNLSKEVATVYEFDGIVGKFSNITQSKAVAVQDEYCYLSDGSNGLKIVILDNDSDLLYNGDEVHVYGTDPNNDDTDDDEIIDGEEVFVYGTDPNDPDTDQDLIEDGEEIIAGVDTFVTDPLNNDTDGDNLSDGEEVFGIFYPSNPNANATGWIVTNAPLIDDADGDNLLDGAEVKIHLTDPLSDDSEGDGMDDEFEVFYGLDPNFDDSLDDLDGDGLDNISEYNRNTNPSNNDSDQDGLSDGEEVFGKYAPTNPYANATGWIVTNAPNNPNVDNDRLKDGEEVITYLTNPFEADSDSDGLDDYDEVKIHLTDPNSNDTDGDTLPDKWEVDYGTNPFVDDTSFDNDSDQLTNLEEFTLGTDPLDADTDGDQMEDGWEIDEGFDPLDPDDADFDADSDGLTNAEEFLNGTDPYSSDTDGDGMDDQWEVEFGTDPLFDDSDEDYDLDGLTNIQEYSYNTDPYDDDDDNDGLLDGEEVNIYGTDPTKFDTDGDRFSDREEIEAGSDPLNAASTPVTIKRRIYIIVGVIISMVLIIALVIFFIVFRRTRPDMQMFRYIEQQRAEGELSLSVKEISEHLDKKLNKGQVKQLVNEYSESKNLTLVGNHVWLTNKEQLESFLEEDKTTLEVYQDKYPGKDAVDSLKQDIQSHIKAANKLKLNKLEIEFSTLLSSTEKLQKPEKPKVIEEETIEEPESGTSHGFGLPSLDSEEDSSTDTTNEE